jgi:quercetin dioxygenase-like cupin family protein
MKNVSLSNAPKVPFDLEGYIMHSSSTLEVIHLCIQPGQNIPQHTNPFDVVACLIEGEVAFNTGENQTRLRLYDAVEIEKDLARGFSNDSASIARLLILKKLQDLPSFKSD